MTPPKSQLAFQLKTLFMGSDGTIPESYARTVEKKHLVAWIKEGLIEHRRSEKLYALTLKGETGSSSLSLGVLGPSPGVRFPISDNRSRRQIEELPEAA